MGVHDEQTTMDRVPTGTAEIGIRTTKVIISRTAHSTGRVSVGGGIGTNNRTKGIVGYRKAKLLTRVKEVIITHHYQE